MYWDYTKQQIIQDTITAYSGKRKHRGTFLPERAPVFFYFRKMCRIDKMVYIISHTKVAWSLMSMLSGVKSREALALRSRPAPANSVGEKNSRSPQL